MRLLLVALWLTALVRPHCALVALTLLVPFGTFLLASLDAAPVRYTEALVVATLAGALVASRRPPLTALRPQTPPVAPAAILFCALVACSAAVGLTVAQVGSHGPWLFLPGFATFLARDYLVGPPAEFVGIVDAARLIEGVGLSFLVARHARDGVMRPVHLLRAFAIAGGVAAAISLRQLIVSAGTANSLRELVTRLLVSRTSIHVADVNAAGSYFAMAGFVALALAFWRPATEAPRARGNADGRWLAVAVAVFAAVWLTGSRMAVLATIGALVVTAAAAGPIRLRQRSRWWVVSMAIGAAIVLGAIAIGLDPRPAAARGVSNMINMRAAFMLTGLRMVASAPAFGVGIGRYFEMSGRFMPSSIYWFYFHENAHNNFLQIAGELGLVGLGAFVWLIVAATFRLARGLRVSSNDRLLVGACAAIGAFITTWLTGHPMIVDEVAYPFWILLGVAIARADGDVQPPLAASVHPSRTPRVSSRMLQLVAAGAASLLVASIPLRARREAATLNLAEQTYGFYGWEQEGGQRFRWTSRRATFFIPAAARELQLPLRAIHIGGNTTPTKVSIAISGRTFHKVELEHDDWTTVRMLLPRDTDRNGFRRVDIITSPAWSPAALVGGRTDVRVLGVEVGEPMTR